MFPVVHPKTGMCDAFFFILSTEIENRKTAICNLFINRTEDIHTHILGRGHILFDISFANKSVADSNV